MVPQLVSDLGVESESNPLFVSALPSATECVHHVEILLYRRRLDTYRPV